LIVDYEPIKRFMAVNMKNVIMWLRKNKSPMPN